MSWKHQHSRRSEPAADFRPGSGWYKREGFSAPGSEADLDGKRLAAFPCTVFQMRSHGVQVPARELLHSEHPSGGLLYEDEYTCPHWHASLYRLPDMKEKLLYLHDAVLTRESNGSRLYLGVQWDAGPRVHWKQTWLCTPTVDVGLEILKKMLGRT